jgi:hypothetical protein
LEGGERSEIKIVQWRKEKFLGETKENIVLCVNDWSWGRMGLGSDRSEVERI